MIGLNLIPCGDNHSEEIAIEHASDRDCGDHEESDFCSPFCWCNCCSIQIAEFQKNDASVTYLTREESVSTTFYKNPFQDQFNGSILQPPQL
jgi:hypothetical protein